MTDKEKALILYDRFNAVIKDHTRGISIKPLAKECALIAIDEVIHFSTAHAFIGLTEQYLEVKKEIEKL